MSVPAGLPSRAADGSLTPLLVQSTTGRSGTTLMMQLLATSPLIAFDRVPPYETRCLAYLLHLTHALAGTGSVGQQFGQAHVAHAPTGQIGTFPRSDLELWDGRLLSRRGFSHLWREFSRIAVEKSEQLGRSSALLYAEKAHTWVPRALNGLGVPYRIVFLMRDPRDVFLSINAFDSKRGFLGFSRLAADDDQAFAARLVRSYRELVANIRAEESRNGDFYVAIYENLVANLSGESSRLAAWLGAELHPEQVVADEARFAHHMTSPSVGESADRWRREMSPSLSSYFARELGDLLAPFGYFAARD